MYNELCETRALDSTIDQLILDFDKTTNQVLVEVNPSFVKNLKPHQADGVRFLYDSTIETVERLRNTRIVKHSPGCILAHSMGLGKTFQVVAFLHTVMTNKHTGDHVKRVMIIVPYNVAKNWVSEFRKWFDECNISEYIQIYEMVDTKKIDQRISLLRRWFNNGGVLIITLKLCSLLLGGKRLPEDKYALIRKYMAEPGPDFVVIDEGHLLKNDKSIFNVAVSKIRTRRRVILTGTPLQNNLSEYYVMVNFVKPDLLGDKMEFQSRFEDPITRGQHRDSTHYEVMLMKKRVHVLHNFLRNTIHRCDYTVLVPYLQPKFEYVLFIRLSETQSNLYRCYLQTLVTEKSHRYLFADYSVLRLVW